MSFEHSLKRGVLFGFVPHPLEIEERPDLNIFPFNVLFLQFKVKDGKMVAGSALYEPDLGSYKQREKKCSMEYHNVYGGHSWLVIEYNSTNKSYLGKKIVNEKFVGMATGVVWDMFFSHFTALGLAEGEQCKFEDA